MNDFVHPLPIKDTPWPVTQGWAEHPEVYRALGMQGHNGVDLGAGEGTPVHAVQDGMVIYAGEGSGHPLLGAGAGNAVLVGHEGPEGRYMTGYAHLRNVWVAAGEEVKAGQVIGCVGSTGFASGPHLHFELIKLDPLQIDNGFMGRVDPSELIP